MSCDFFPASGEPRAMSCLQNVLGSIHNTTPPGAMKGDPMKAKAFNGSPRKKWNTATLLEKALAGAASQGAEMEMIHLYDLHFKGCRSCFACKTKGGKSYGRCVVKDDLAPILKGIEKTDVLILGSPFYLGTVSGEMRSFMERLLFPYLTYTDPPRSLFPKKIPTGFIYTMNVTEERMKEQGYGQHVGFNERLMGLIFGATESLFSFDTYQFEDYSKVVADRFDPEKKAKRRNDVFPQDCAKALEMGARLTRKAG
jgi:multimeric flavodoxin WrbA